MGFALTSTGSHFESFMGLWEGSWHLMLGYENQIVEYARLQSEAFAVMKEKLRVLYPEETGAAHHPLIALTEGGERLLRATKHPEFQRVGREKFGYRSSNLTVMAGPSIAEEIGLTKVGIPELSLPTWRVLEEMTQQLQQR